MSHPTPPGGDAPDIAALTPGGEQFGALVASFDETMERVMQRWRGNLMADRLFVTASTLGDWSLIWHLVGVSRALTDRQRGRQSLALAALLGAESLIVNQGVKRLVNRPRPTTGGADGLTVRTPSTSSFPSGHASAAAFAAVVLTGFDGRRSAPLWWSLAAVVAVSRVHVRIHHASDVVAGAAVGVVLGSAARRVTRHLRR